MQRHSETLAAGTVGRRLASTAAEAAASSERDTKSTCRWQHLNTELQRRLDADEVVMRQYPFFFPLSPLSFRE